MVNFQDYDVFGNQFMTKRRNMECTLTSMILKGVINSDGTVDTTEHDLFKVGISDMWCYMYYLWQQNRNLKSFKYFENNKGIPVANQFINSVVRFGYSQNATRLAQQKSIAYFINDVFAHHQEMVNVPILSQLVDKLVGRIINKEQSLLSTVQAREKPANGIKLWYENANTGFTKLYKPSSSFLSQY